MAKRSNEIRAYFSRTVESNNGHSSAEGKHVVGYNKTCETVFAPVYPEEIVSGMLCSVCKQHSTKKSTSRLCGAILLV